MRNRMLIVIVVLCAGVLSACDSGETPPPPPTLFPSPTADEPTLTTEPAVGPTNTPPSWRELPPTWTFTPEPTATEQLVMPTQPPLPITAPELPSACDTFVPDTERSQRDFPIGGRPVVAWTPVEGALSYRLALVDALGNELLVEFIAENTFTFEADLFRLGQRYGWEVYPRDHLAIQMCFSVGGELVPFRQ